MLKLLKFATAMVLLAGWGLAALSLHVVRNAGSVHLIPKNELSVGDTYVDVSHWKSDDEEKHPALYARLKQLDQTNLLDEVAVDDAPEPSAPVATSSYDLGMKKAWDRVNRSRR